MNLSPTALPVRSQRQADPARSPEREGRLLAGDAVPRLFQGGVDGRTCPRYDKLAASLTPTRRCRSSTTADGSRVPCMAELDANAGPPTAIARRSSSGRMTRLTPATRYIVALVGLKDTTGKPLVAARRSRRCATGRTLSKSLQPLRREIRAKSSPTLVGRRDALGADAGVGRDHGQRRDGDVAPDGHGANAMYRRRRRAQLHHHLGEDTTTEHPTCCAR